MHVSLSLHILIVDDDPLVSALIKDTLRDRGFAVASATTAVEAKQKSLTFSPDVVLLDVDLGPGPSGFDVASSLRHADPTVGILFLTNIAEPRLTEPGTNLVPAGAGYLLKNNIVDINVLLNAIKSVANGNKSMSFRDDKNPSHALSSLSRSQLDVLRLVAAGKSNEEIATMRGTTTRAVRLLVARAMSSLGIDESGGPEKRVKAALEYLKVTGLRK